MAVSDTFGGAVVSVDVEVPRRLNQRFREWRLYDRWAQIDWAFLMSLKNDQPF